MVVDVSADLNVDEDLVGAGRGEPPEAGALADGVCRLDLALEPSLRSPTGLTAVRRLDLNGVVLAQLRVPDLSRLRGHGGLHLDHIPGLTLNKEPIEKAETDMERLKITHASRA